MQKIFDFLYRLWLSFVDFVNDFFLFIVDALLGLAVAVIGGLGAMFQALDVTQYITALPPEVLNIISLIGFGEAMGIIATAGAIRITLQLIPFVRLGS